MFDQPAAVRVYVCHGVDCGQRGARGVWNTLQFEVQRRGLDASCELIVSGCQGRCEVGPNLNVYPNLTKYSQLTADKVRRIVDQHLAGGTPVADLRYKEQR